VTTLLSSANFWILALTAVAFFVSYCYLDALYKSFNLPWGNVSVSDVLIKGIPALGALVGVLLYLVAEPAFPWHGYLTNLTLASRDFVRFVLVLAAACALVAIATGKFRARRLRQSKRRVDIETDQRVWRNVVLLAFGKDLIAIFDPEVKRSFLLPWNQVKKIEGRNLTISEREAHEEDNLCNS
jgi:hypothetical protein